MFTGFSQIEHFCNRSNVLDKVFLITDASASVKALMASHFLGFRFHLCMLLGINLPLHVGCLILDYAVILLVTLIEIIVKM